MTSPAVFQAAAAAIEGLESLQMAYCLVGGLALPAWRYLRETHDTDLLLATSATNTSEMASRIVPVLRDQGFAHLQRADRRRIDEKLVLHFHWPLREQALSIRVDLILAEGPYYEGVVQRRVRSRIDGIETWVASCEDLMVLKMSAARPVDIADARALWKLHGPSLDRVYIEHWIRGFQLATQWKEVTRPEDARDAF